jgi:hypothetical protein
MYYNVLRKSLNGRIRMLPCDQGEPTYPECYVLECFEAPLHVKKIYHCKTVHESDLLGQEKLSNYLMSTFFHARFIVKISRLGS